MEGSERADSGIDQDGVEWVVWLFRRHPGRGLFALAVCVFTSWFAWSFTNSAWLTGLAAFVLVASLSSFFFPTRYSLDSDGVRVINFIYRRRRRWIEFRDLRQQGGRVKLLTLPYDSRLDNYRGMLLILPEDAEPVLAFLRARIQEAHSDPA